MSRKFKIGGSEKSLREWWKEKMDAEKAKNEADRDEGWKDKITDAEAGDDDFKNAEFKINKKGEMEPVTANNPLGIDDIKVTGSKSSLRRIADLERNVTVLANRISTIDEETDIEDGSESLFDNWITEETAFTKDVTIGKGSSSSWWSYKDTGDATRVDIDGHLYINNGMTLGSTATDVIQDLVGAMFSGNSESGISVDYKTDGTVDFNVNDPTITLAGDLTGSATMTNLGNVSITATVKNDSHTHAFDNLTGKPTTLSGYGITDAAADTAFTGVSVNNDTLTFSSAGGTDVSVSISDANTWRSITDSLTSTSSSVSLSAKAGNDLNQAIAVERGRIDTLVGGVDVSTLDTIVEIQSAINANQAGISTLVAKTSAQALRATDALTVSNDTITIHKGDGTSESVTISDAYENYSFWTAKDHDGTTYPLTSQDVLWFKEGAGMDVNFTADDELTFTNTDRGSAQNIFKNIAVSGQSTIVADNNNDTLTIAAGSNITLTTNATTDTLTIAATDTNTWRPVVDVPVDDSAKSISAKWALSAFVGATVSNDTITFTKGDGTTTSVTTSDANSNTYITGLSFNTGDGTLTATRNSGSVAVDLDGRYQLAGSYAAASHSHAFNDLTGKTGGTGDYATTGDLVSGKGSGGVALTINDGYGNANVTWNHQNGVPEQNGNAARIEVNTDSTTGASMSFELKSGVTSGTATNLTTALTLTETLATFAGDVTVSGGDVNATRFNGTATYAKYADLAERYAADAPYAEGTVVVFGGEAEVTASTSFAQRSVAGVVSLRPAVAMNAEAGNNETHPFIALQGRVPVKVTGDVKKGDILVASDVAGTATAWTNDDADPRMTAYVGIAISDAVDGFVEVKVGK